MTIAQTIITAQEYANRGHVEAACKIIRKRMVTAKRGKDQMRLDIARIAILDTSIDAMVARSNA